MPTAFGNLVKADKGVRTLRVVDAGSFVCATLRVFTAADTGQCEENLLKGQNQSTLPSGRRRQGGCRKTAEYGWETS